MFIVSYNESATGWQSVIAFTDFLGNPWKSLGFAGLALFIVVGFPELFKRESVEITWICRISTIYCSWISWVI